MDKQHEQKKCECGNVMSSAEVALYGKCENCWANGKSNRKVLVEGEQRYRVTGSRRSSCRRPRN